MRAFYAIRPVNTGQKYRQNVKAVISINTMQRQIRNIQRLVFQRIARPVIRLMHGHLRRLITKVIFLLKAAGIRGLVAHNVIRHREIIQSSRVLLPPVMGTHIIKAREVPVV